MNEFESQFLEKAMGAIHDLELKMTEGFTELRGEIKHVSEKVENNGDKFDVQTATETKRLDKHSEEIDSLRDGLTDLKARTDNNWKWILALAAWAAAIAALFAKYL